MGFCQCVMMGRRELVVFVLVLVCFGLCEARFLKVKMPTRWAVKDQKPAEGEAEPPAAVASKLQSRWFPPAEELPSWKFPEHLEDPVKRLPVPFEPQRLERRHRVGVRCGESRIQVEVSQDLLGIGKLVKPEEITLGGCSAIEVDDLAHVLVFESELHSCGSRLVV